MQSSHSEAAAPKTIYRRDYQSPDYHIESVDLTFELHKHKTRVTACMQIVRQADLPVPLCLHGDGLVLQSIALDDVALTSERYTVTPDSLTLETVPKQFTLTLATYINPAENTTLSGLYYADDLFCTQCEAHGFRRMMYFLDRPDVMATYTTTIIADKTQYPVLLSNGNLVDSGQGQDNTHWVKWVDPFKKPSYLFALVAGQLDCLSDHYETMSGRDVKLQIFVEKGKKGRAHHAMYALKQSMAWDERVFGREYDLDIFMIVAVSSFNMGAMENKGLNIFNDKYILADPHTATDADYDAVTLVVGHEYFHNWTGNRITCRDWFQLSLKEGLTVFRESLFMQEQTSKILRRIQDARTIKSAQFAEDASPMAHPVRPDSYVEINNFYTVTVYNKGAEVINMLYTLVGEAGFRAGMDAYFARFDGQAVTIDDFVDAIASENDFDKAAFLHWYSQSGTPFVQIKASYDQTQAHYTLTCEQRCPATPGQPDKNPFLIPIVTGLLDAKTGHELDKQVLQLTQSQQSFVFKNVEAMPVPSLFRHFSAPVKWHFDYTQADLLHILRYDTDDFNRWDALQTLASRLILDLAQAVKVGNTLSVSTDFLDALQDLLKDNTLDLRFVAECWVLPAQGYLAEQVDVIDVQAIHTAREFVRVQLAQHCLDALLSCYHRHVGDPYVYSAQDNAKRALKNQCLSYVILADPKEGAKLCFKQFKNADNMTDTLAALSILADHDLPEREQALSAFYEKWQHDPLVLDKWFAVQAASALPHTLKKVKALMQLPTFTLKNPNRVRALVGAFVMGNPVQFHAKDGAGYVFLADVIEDTHQMNPQLAARLVRALMSWHRYEPTGQALMKQQLVRLSQIENLSKDVFEVVVKSLEMSASA